VGVAVVFSDASSPSADVLKRTWNTPSGTVPHEPGISLKFPSPGCYAITLTTLFKDGQSRTASTNIAVGGATCN
jgi:hypothetical protein